MDTKTEVNSGLAVLLERTRAFHRELFRKSIHLLVGIVPLLAALDLTFTRGMLLAGLFVFLYAEKVRLSGQSLPFITAITLQASRPRDQHKMIMGPITLGLGAFLTLALFQEPTASVGIFALAFGDGLSSVVGKIFGKVRLPFTGGKTLEGTLTVFAVVLPVALSAGGSFQTAVIVAVCAAFLEALPLEDLDNLVLPLGTALIFSFLRG